MLAPVAVQPAAAAEGQPCGSSGKCPDVQHGSPADGATVFQWTCYSGADQKWRIEDLANDTSRLANVATGEVMDTAACASADGTDIAQWSWLNNNCRQWQLQERPEPIGCRSRLTT
jgi:hypothetical protein